MDRANNIWYKHALYVIFLFLSSFTTYAQQVIELKNPSLEAEDDMTTVLAVDWDSDKPFPNTGPGSGYEPSRPASHGRHWIEMYCRYGYNMYSVPENQLEFYSQAIGQQLAGTLYAGKTYMLSFDLRMPVKAKNTEEVAYGSLVIWGSAARRTEEELLYASGRIYNDDWKRFTAFFTPSKDLQYIRITSAQVGNDTVTVVTFIDNLSPITETLQLDITTIGACPNESNGSASVNMRNQTENYDFLWTPGDYTTSSVNNLSAGTYQLTVTGKSSGTVSKREVVIPSLDFPTVQNVIGASCYGMSDASIEITASNGQAPYTYTLDNQMSNTSGVFNNLRAGLYNVQVEDQRCVTQVSVNVPEPAPLQLQDIQTKAIICTTASDGQIILTPTGGTYPYSYSINSGPPVSDSIFINLDDGTYQYTVTDSHLCTIDGQAYIDRNLRDCAVYVPTAFSPNGDGNNDVFRIKLQDAITDYKLSVFGRWGQLVYESHDPHSTWNGKLREMPLPAGSYVWSITYTNSSRQPIKQTGVLMMIL